MKNLMRELPRELEIVGVMIGQNRLITYKDSFLVEAYRDGWESMYSQIRHLYWIVTPKGEKRDWGVHERTTDVYSCVYGEIEVALFDSREDQSSCGTTLVVKLNGRQGESLMIPPGVWHTFRALSREAVLLNSKTPPWDQEKPDKKVFPLEASLPPFAWTDI